MLRLLIIACVLCLAVAAPRTLLASDFDDGQEENTHQIRPYDIIKLDSGYAPFLDYMDNMDLENIDNTIEGNVYPLYFYRLDSDNKVSDGIRFGSDVSHQTSLEDVHEKEGSDLSNTTEDNSIGEEDLITETPETTFPSYFNYQTIREDIDGKVSGKFGNVEVEMGAEDLVTEKVEVDTKGNISDEDMKPTKVVPYEWKDLEEEFEPWAVRQVRQAPERPDEGIPEEGVKHTNKSSEEPVETIDYYY